MRKRILGLVVMAVLAVACSGPEESLRIDVGRPSLAVGDSTNFTTHLPGETTPIANEEVSAVSDNPTVIEVRSGNWLYAASSGTATVSVAAAGRTAPVRVTGYRRLTDRWFRIAPRSGGLPLFEFFISEGSNGSITFSGRSYNHSSGLFIYTDGTGRLQYPEISFTATANGQDQHTQSTSRVLTFRGRMVGDGLMEGEITGPGFSGTVQLNRED